MQRIKYISVFAISLLIAGVLLGFAIDRSGDSRCEGLDVVLTGDGNVHFINQTGVIQFIHDHGHKVVGDTMSRIDSHTMELDILNIPYVENVEVYKTIDRRVSVKVRQRIPVMRLFFTDGTSVYVDDKGKYMITSEEYSHKCLPVTGLKAPTVADVSNSQIAEGTQTFELWSMARFIDQDDFWRSQILQVDMDDKCGATLIPRVGNHEIIMGSTDDFLIKLDKLMEFYDQGIAQTNWNIYKSLDLRFKGQVVAVKR